MKLSEAPQVNSINSEYITLMDANGSPLKINKADLAEVIRNNMPVATTDKNGLYGKSYYSLLTGDRIDYILEISMEGEYIIKILTI